MAIFDYMQVVDTSSSNFCELRRLQLPAGSGTQKPAYAVLPMTVPSYFLQNFQTAMAKPNR